MELAKKTVKGIENWKEVDGEGSRQDHGPFRNILSRQQVGVNSLEDGPKAIKDRKMEDMYLFYKGRIGTK